MKQLLALIVLIVVLGLGAFLYRYQLERPAGIAGRENMASSTPQACTEEAKVCPDGSAVGRTGPNCSFAACKSPNVELTVGSTTIAFVLPGGYTANTNAVGNDSTLLGAYEKPASAANTYHAIVVRAFPVAEGKTAEQTMLDNTMFESSGIVATSTNQFKKTTIGGKNFYSVVVERFEGQIHSVYYVLGTNTILRFEVLEKDVPNWSDPKLGVSNLPQHQALMQMLSTLQLVGF